VEWVVTTGKSIEEAKEAALDELGVDEQDAEFEILEEPRMGLFGRQRGEARVRARVRPSAPRPKTDRRERRRRRPDGTSRGEGAGDEAEAGLGNGQPGGRTSAATGATRGSGQAGEGRAPAGARAPRQASGTSRAAAGQARTAVAEVAEAGDATAGGGAGEGGGGGSGEARPGRRRRGRRPEAQPGLVEGDGVGEDADEAGDPAEDGGMMGEQELDLAQQAEVAESFVRGLLERFALPAETTTVTVDEETIEVQVTGPELGLLIGPKGQTLQAVQELTRTAVQRKASNRTGRILVDVARYRVRRREALERFTRQVADDVRASGVQRVLEPMSPADRKIVHDTANTLGGVRTISEGEEPHRRVVILPGDEPASPDA
jgi:spoIIIJ-associated protein